MAGRGAPPHQRLGGKIGPRIARLTADAMTHHLRQSAGVRSRIAAQGGVQFFKTITSEVHATASPIAKAIAEHPDTPEHLRPLLRFMAEGEGEWQALLSYAAYGSGLATPITAAIANWLAPVQQDLIRQAPHGLLPAALAASLAARGIISTDEGFHEASGQGIAQQRYLDMVDGAIAYPDAAQLLDSLNRGHASVDQVQVALQRAGFSDDWIARIVETRRQLLAPADLALMALRGIIPEAEGAQRAGQVGVSGGDFALLVGATGEPLGLEQLLEAYRRGFIDQARLERGIRQSRVRNEWIDVAEKLRFSPATASDALRGVVQGHLSDADGRKIAEDNGLRPADWDWLVQTEGNPIAPGQALELLNRGEMTEAQVRQAIRESRIKNKYTGDVVKLARRLIPERTVVSALGHGAISHDAAITTLRDHGFNAADAEVLVKLGAAQHSAKERELTKGEVLSLHTALAISDTEASGHLKALGYPPATITLLLRLSDLQRARAERDQAIDAVRSHYLARHIDAGEASGELDGIGVPHAQRDRLLRLWAIELRGARRTLTEAQVVHAHTAGLLTDDQAHQRLLGMGYSAGDADLLLAKAPAGRTRA